MISRITTGSHRALALALAATLATAGCSGSTSNASAAITAPGAPGTHAAPPEAHAQHAADNPPAAGDFASRTGTLNNPDDTTMVFLYHDLAGVPPPLDDWAEQDMRVRIAAGPDKAARRAQARAELLAGVAAVRDVGRLHLAMDANLSDYDPTYGEFTIGALAPSSQVVFAALGEKVALTFDNALDAQSWSVAAADAQAVRDRINRGGVKMDLTVQVDKVLPGPGGGTIVARIVHYDLRESNGDTALARIDVPAH